MKPKRIKKAKAGFYVRVDPELLKAANEARTRPWSEEIEEHFRKMLSKNHK